MDTYITNKIMAVITTASNVSPGGAPVFKCQSKDDLYSITANLEAILDGIAHALNDEIYIIVKH
ncbi:capping complex subunit for YIEGIA [Peribacillus kribbensis]|uniref:capping complex subunit for YIEGIA n=1 Tax=Peribacillus kribbensis TaxID=356658 RepID=UPI0004011C3F|nr:hypothetical protein [Peribacillus kribbensis]